MKGRNQRRLKMLDGLNPNPDEQGTPPEVGQPAPDPIATVMAEIETLKTSLKNLERINSRKESENKRLQEQLDSRDAEQATIKAAMTLLASRTGQTEEEVATGLSTGRQDLATQFDRMVENERRKRETEQQQRRITSYQQQTQDLGLSPDSKEYLAIFGAVASGRFDKADKLIEELTVVRETPKEVQKPVEKSKPTDEETRAYLEAQGLLKTNTPNPSSSKGQIWTMDQIRKMEPKEYAKHFPGGFPEVMQGVREGKIKV